MKKRREGMFNSCSVMFMLLFITNVLGIVGALGDAFITFNKRNSLSNGARSVDLFATVLFRASNGGLRAIIV